MCRSGTYISRGFTLPLPDALAVQRPLPDGLLKIVATGEKEDGAVAGNPHEQMQRS